MDAGGIEKERGRERHRDRGRKLKWSQWYSSRLVVRRSMRLVRFDCMCVCLSLLFVCLASIVRLSFAMSCLLLSDFLVSTHPAYLRLISLPYKGNIRNPRDGLMSSTVGRKKGEALAENEKISEGRKRRK